jgi:hypothetical protein
MEQKKNSKKLTKYSVMIPISRLRESPERAVKSVMELADQVAEIIFVSQHITKDTLLYRTWKKDQQRLKDEYKILIRFVDRFDTDVVPNTHLLLELAPLVQLKDKDGRFKRDVNANYGKLNKYQRFAFDVKTDFSQAGFSLWYVFLCVVFCLDWWRSLFAWFTFHTKHHVRFTEVWQGGERRVSPPHRSPWISCCGYWSHGDRSPVQSSNGKCITGPQGHIKGSWYFLYYMNQRDGISGNGWRLWYALCGVFYAAFGVAWWGPVFTLGLGLLKLDKPWLTFALNPFSTLRVGIIIASILVHGYILRANFKWSMGFYNVLVPILFPLVIPVVIPWIIWWSKISNARAVYEDSLEVKEEEEEENELDTE